MKRVVATVVLIGLTIDCTYTLKHYTDYKEVRPAIISEHVGEVVDAEERVQFDLFREVSDFKSATFYTIQEGGYKVEIVAGDKMLVAVNRDSNAVAILRDYIDRYDEIRQSHETFEREWNVIDYDTLGMPITSNELKSIRKTHYACGCAGGSWLMGLVPNFVLSFFVIGGLTIEIFGTAESELKRPLPAWISFILINIGTGVAGALVGNRFDKNAALNAIKEARLPKKLK